MLDPLILIFNREMANQRFDTYEDLLESKDKENTTGILQLRDEPSEEDMDKYLPQLQHYSQ